MKVATVTVEFYRPMNHTGRPSVMFVGVVEIEGREHQEVAVVISSNYRQAFFGMVELAKCCQELAVAADGFARRAKARLSGNGASG